MTNKKRFFAVIHVETLNQAARNAKIAFDNGADGIFLINHNIPATYLLEIYNRLRIVHPKDWIGLNLLDLSAGNALDQLPVDADALWLDSPTLVGCPSNAPFWYKAQEFWKARAQYPNWKGLCFVGVAFKGQPYADDLATVAKTSAKYMDVVTTSGNATGEAPTVRKLEIIREAIGKDKLLALASGATPENVSDFLPTTDSFLVNTGISIRKSFTELDPRRVRKMADGTHSS